MVSTTKPLHPSKQTVCKCGECENDLVANQAVALLCNSCNIWHCYQCIGVSENIFKALIVRSVDTSMITVSCKACMRAIFPINLCKANREVCDQIKVLTETVESFKKETNSIVKESTKEIVTEITVLKTDSKKTWADAVKLQLESSETMVALHNTVKKNTNRNQIQLNEREKSIIIFRHPESVKQTIIERKKDDREFVDKFIDHGLRIPSQEIESVIRLGQYNDKKIDQ